MLIEWKDEYSVHVEEIDNQHRKIIDFINKIDDVIRTGVITQVQISEIFFGMKEYANFHLKTEEKYFEEFKYDGRVEHTAIHDRYRKTIEEFGQKVNNVSDNDLMSLAFEMIDFLEDWWVEHILHEDQKYVKTFNEHGLS